MLRVWFFLSLLLFAPVGGGLWPSASSGDVCVQSCRDDDERGQCAPDCIDCVCCSHAHQAVVAPTPSTVSWARRAAPAIEHDEDEPPSAEPGDILHVPIAPLA